MIHLSTRSPLEGDDCAVLYGKGPSYDPGLFKPFATRIAINDAWTEDMDFVALRDWTTAERLKNCPLPALVEQRVWFRYPLLWPRRALSWYFDGMRVKGTNVDSESVPGRKLGVGTATAVLQLLGQAGCKEVWLNGFDAFWGGEIRYHPVFEGRGLSHEDYAEQFPISGTPDEQAALVRESMRYVADEYGITLRSIHE